MQFATTMISKLTLSSLSLAPSAPENFMLSAVTNNPRQLNASWTEPVPANGMIQNYTVTCVQTSNGTNRAFTFDKTLLQVTLMGLFPYTDYECSVFATTNGGAGGPSNTEMARTAEDGERESILMNYGSLIS